MAGKQLAQRSVAAAGSEARAGCAIGGRCRGAAYDGRDKRPRARKPHDHCRDWAAFLRIQLIFSLVKLRFFRADRSAITYPLAHLSKTRHRLCLCLCQRDPCGHGGVSGAEQRREPGSVDTNERLVAGYGRGEGPERRTEAGPGTRPHRNHSFTLLKSISLANIRLFFAFFFLLNF